MYLKLSSPSSASRTRGDWASRSRRAARSYGANSFSSTSASFNLKATGSRRAHVAENGVARRLAQLAHVWCPSVSDNQYLRISASIGANGLVVNAGNLSIVDVEIAPSLSRLSGVAERGQPELR